jgi:tetratricopeptide (TPR) repeat protein
MNLPASSDAANRLQRLAGYLAQDRENAALLAEACDAAIACGRHELADEFIVAARQLAVVDAGWTFRRARLCIARRQLTEAAALLEQLRSETGEHAVLAHDAAYVRLLQGDSKGARALLQPWMARLAATPGLARDQREALQVLWLRASHREGLLEAAWEWAQQERAEGRLEPAASGVASLIALDLEDLDAARALADAALSVDARQVEALVARGSVALASGDAAEATVFLEGALLSNPDDGRTWSALGFASLLQQDLPRAKSQLERALQAMPEHVESWHALGWTRLLLADRNGALAAFRSGLVCDPDYAESHAALALALWLCGEKEDADRHLQEADRLDPECAIGRQARAFIAGGQGDPAMLDALTRRVLAQWTRRP